MREYRTSAWKSGWPRAILSNGSFCYFRCLFHHFNPAPSALINSPLTCRYRTPVPLLAQEVDDICHRPSDFSVVEFILFLWLVLHSLQSLEEIIISSFQGHWS